MDLLQSALKYGHTSSQFMAANGETLQQQTQRQNFDSSVVYYIQIQDIPFLWFLLLLSGFEEEFSFIPGLHEQPSSTHEAALRVTAEQLSLEALIKRSSQSNTDNEVPR